MNAPLTGAPVRCAGAAAAWVRDTVAGSLRSGRVLHPGADAVYVEVGGACLGLLTTRAVRVPCGIRTPLASLPPLQVGAPVTVGGGAVNLPGLEVVVTTLLDTTMPMLSLDCAERAVRPLEEQLGDRLDSVRDELPPSALTALRNADPAAVRQLLGLGPGLTPLGDDVLAGWLAAAIAIRHPSLPALRAAVAATAVERTTTLSATLLTRASHGEGVPELGSLFTGIGIGEPAVVAESVELLLGIGGTSGAGILLGTLIALQSLARSGAPA